MIRSLCPICHKAMEAERPEDMPYLPFCSQRCKTIDLGRWLGESYRLPADEPDEDVVDEEQGGS